MQLNENSNSVETPSADSVVIVEDSSLTPTVPAKQLRNQHLKVEEPKNKQFTARCTESEHRIISAAMAANGCTDIVRLMLFSINLHKKDFFTSFKLS